MPRLRKQLQGADAKEKESAFELARAEVNKKRAAEALANADGLHMSGGPSGAQAPDAGNGSPALELRTCSNVFDKLEEWVCEESDRAAVSNTPIEIGTMQDACRVE